MAETARKLDEYPDFTNEWSQRKKSSKRGDGKVIDFNKAKKDIEESKNLQPQYGSKIEKDSDYIGDWNRRLHQRPGKSDKKSQKPDERTQDKSVSKRSDKKADYKATLNRLKALRRASEKGGIKEEVKQALYKVIRIKSYEGYLFCWKSLIPSYGASYFGLLFLYIIKYVKGDQRVIKFVSLIKPATVVTKNIIAGNEKTSIPMLIAFWSITVAIISLTALSIIIIIIYFAPILKIISFLAAFGEAHLKAWNVIF